MTIEQCEALCRRDHGAVIALVTALLTVASPAWPAGTVQFADAVIELAEGQDRSVIVVRTGDTAGSAAVVLEVDTAQGTADRGTDFAVDSPTGVVEFAPGEIFRRVAVTAIAEVAAEGVEHALLRLHSPTGAVLGPQSELRLVLRDSPAPEVSYRFSSSEPRHVGDVFATLASGGSEGDALVLPVALAPTTAMGAVDVSVLGGSATLGVDYADPTARLYFTAGAASLNVSLVTLEDSLPEAIETVELLLTNASPEGATGPNAFALALIEDDDQSAGRFVLLPPSGGGPDVYVNEGDGTINLRVQRLGGATGAVTVDYATIGSGRGASAVAGRDYVAATETLSFGQGVTERTLPVTLVDNDEASLFTNEFRVVLANAVGGSSIDPRWSGVWVTVNDNEPLCPDGETDCLGDIAAGAVVCFIATAAYGSYLDPHVVTLRAFRDRHLLTHPLGRLFVAWYYRVSPPVAARIAKSPPLRVLVRLALTPVVFGVAEPGWAAALLLALLTLCVRLRLSRARSRSAGA